MHTPRRFRAWQIEFLSRNEYIGFMKLVANLCLPLQFMHLFSTSLAGREALLVLERFVSHFEGMAIVTDKVYHI